MEVVKYEKIESLGSGYLWELYSSILSFFVFLLSLIFFYKKSAYGYLFLFVSIASAFYLYFSWKNRIRKSLITIDMGKMEFQIKMGNQNLVWNLKDIVSFYLDGNYKTATSYLKISFVSGRFYYFRGHIQNSDILKVYQTLQSISNSENLQITETLGPNRLVAYLILGIFFLVLTLYSLYLVFIAFFRL
ncbi:hypothetical protein [Leptospira brenneri]|uniref:hypothetical protein n=1 Tax=Leptospira brenneri TaxID=2023182 RepID=UPI000C2A1745|nr:hypothetical protein [Leptospira brenneri]PJZ44109.1 hypothetical protein CH361_17390 [Leptospira brenneri]